MICCIMFGIGAKTRPDLSEVQQLLSGPACDGFDAPFREYVNVLSSLSVMEIGC